MIQRPFWQENPCFSESLRGRSRAKSNNYEADFQCVMKLQIADDTFVFVMRADPEPKVAAIFKSCQCAEARTGADFDFLEAEGFQRRIFLPELEILAGDFLNLRWQDFKAVPKLRQRGRFYGKDVALPAR